MKKIKEITCAMFLLILGNLAIADSQLNNTAKSFPEVTFDKVEEIFGHNLDTDDTSLKTLLLAIGMDHTTPGSPNTNLEIGIPYIVHKGPNYWVKKLRNGEIGVDVLVNNGLLLLFTKENIPNSEQVGVSLLKRAANLGYWPADYFIAEKQLSEYLTLDYTNISPRTSSMSTKDIEIARDTMIRYNRCAEMGFAPCQYRIGFWLAASDRTLEEGITVLQQAINTTVNDSRYIGTLDGAMINASAEIVLKGEQVGIDSESRENYVNLVKMHIAKMERESREIKQDVEE